MLYKLNCWSDIDRFAQFSTDVCVAENCTNYKLQFERVFSVPGDIAMLNSTLVSSDVFNFTAVPYNITWYDLKTDREMSDQIGRIMVRGETLWFLNVTMEDDGEYETIVRYGSISSWEWKNQQKTCLCVWACTVGITAYHWKSSINFLRCAMYSFKFVVHKKCKACDSAALLQGPQITSAVRNEI